VKTATQTLATFVADATFERLPREVVHETKRILLDIVGCAVGSVDLDKGRIAINMAREFGSRPEATLLGTQHRVSASIAAFAGTKSPKPPVRAFMEKVTIKPYPRVEEMRHQELVVERKPYIERRPCSIQVLARGKHFTQTAEYATWLAVENGEFRATDEDLAQKCRANVADTLLPQQAEMVIERIMGLENSATAHLIESLIPTGVSVTPVRFQPS